MIVFENAIHIKPIIICIIGRYPISKNDHNELTNISVPIIVIIKLNVLMGLKIIYIAIKSGINPLIKNDIDSLLFFEKQYSAFLSKVAE